MNTHKPGAAEPDKFQSGLPNGSISRSKSSRFLRPFLSAPASGETIAWKIAKRFGLFVGPRLDGIIQYPSPNWDSRNGQQIVFLILHYTAQPLEEALQRLTDPAAEVSSHYLASKQGVLYQLVNELNRAWHAGFSFWDGYTDINSVSIGIEIVNSGDEPFTEAQMKDVQELILDILGRNAAIRPHYVLGHSDVAVTTQNHKLDPGWFFDWKSLSTVGIGVWPEPTKDDYDESAGWSDDDLKQKLMAYGYTSGTDLPTLVEAFQRHFQQEVAQIPERVGVADADTRARLACLLRLKPQAVTTVQRNRLRALLRRSIRTLQFGWR